MARSITAQERQLDYTSRIHPVLERLVRSISDACDDWNPKLINQRLDDLRHYFDTESGKGNWHPALTETTGDFTALTNPTQALALYELALEQAREIGQKGYTILISMAELQLELGLAELAEAAAVEARTEALESGDINYVNDAERILGRVEARLGQPCAR